MDFERGSEIQTVTPSATLRRVLFFVLVVALFFSYAFLALRAPRGIYNSPDETANAYFAMRFAEEGALHTLEPLEGVARGRLHPRSIAVVEEFLVPGSFHGLPVLFGLLSKVFSVGFLPFLTPLIAVLAVLAWRRLLATLYGARAGNLAAAILAMMPAWWYYTNRGLYHNVLFVAFLIFAGYFFVVRPLRAHLFQAENLLAIKLRRLTPLFDPLVSGLALGAAWWVRTAEVPWTALLAVLLLVAGRKAIRWRELAVFVVATAIAFSPALAVNDALYGNLLRTGYTADAVSLRGDGADEAISAEIATSRHVGTRDDQSLTTPYSLLTTYYIIFPFGLHPRTALIHFMDFDLKLHWGVSIILGAALLWFGYEFLRGRRRQEETILVTIFALVGAWLIMVYGSWVVRDNPDPNAVTIGISYSRYWLPIFVLGSGVVGVAVAHWTARMHSRHRTVLFAICYLLFVAWSAYLVFLSKGDGLIAVNDTLHGYAAVKADVLRRTTEDTIIVVDRGDKIFFPDRRVVAPLREEATYEILLPLSLRAPLYYYGITMTEDDLRYHNEEKLAPIGLKLELVQTYEQETLYRFATR